MMENHDDGASFSTASPVEAPTDIQATDQASIADKPASTRMYAAAWGLSAPNESR
jgi:hypothetical protein